MTSTANRIVADYIAPNGTRVVAVTYNGKHYVTRTSKALRTTIYEGSTRITKTADAALWYGIYDLAFPKVEVAPEATVSRLSNGDYRVTHSGGFSNFGKRGAEARRYAEGINRDTAEAARIAPKPEPVPVDSDDFPAPGAMGACDDDRDLSPCVNCTVEIGYHDAEELRTCKREHSEVIDGVTISYTEEAYAENVALAAEDAYRSRRRTAQMRTPDSSVECAWYALCTNASTGTVKHPILGAVPTCDRCADKHDLDLIRY